MKTNIKFLSLSTVVLVLFLSVAIIGQTENLEELRNKATLLVEQGKYVEASELYEKIVALEPKDAQAHFYLGFTLAAKAKITKDKEQAKQIRLKARKAFLTAKSLGLKEKSLDAFIDSIPEDGSVIGKFSANPEADDLMNEAESLFVQGKIDEALNLYQKALKLDPTIYEAALYSGDMYFRKNDFARAETWYQKAIEINPWRETAYRYSASISMKQEKYDQARDRYIEAYIREPFNRFATAGIIRWAEATGATLGHPRIDVPQTSVGKDGKETTNININPLADDGSMAWVAYIATRKTWKEETFAKTFPNEKTYRHSLAEEADALRSVVKLAKDVSKKEKDLKNLNQQIKLIDKLDTEGLLEAYILMALADEGIFQDYLPFLKKNPEKLRLYVLNYVIGKK